MLLEKDQAGSLLNFSFPPHQTPHHFCCMDHITIDSEFQTNVEARHINMSPTIEKLC